MAQFVKCTSAEGRGGAVWVNLARALMLRRMPAMQESTFSNARPECTQVWFSSNGSDTLDGWDVVYVLEEPSRIVEWALEGAHA